MYRPVVRKPALSVGLLTLLILLLSACDERAQAQKLPENSVKKPAKSIPAGEYVSDEFRPAMSFKLNKGWQTGPAADFSYGVFMETYNRITLSRVSNSVPSYLEFLVIPKVYKVISSYEVKVKPAPNDMVSWLQNNPYLDTERPTQVNIGGKKGKEFDGVASRIPQGYLYGGYHGVNTYYVRHGGRIYDVKPCLPLFETTPSYGAQSTYELCKDYKARFIVLDDVNGKMVTIAVLAPTVQFDESWLKAKQVLHSVEWKDT